MTASWTREQIEELLKREKFTYQRIELPYGLVTDGADRSSTANAILPVRLDGKSVLDLGCNNGYFCFEAAKRGATRVLGLDVDPEMIRKNRLLAEVLGHNVQFDVVNLDRQRLAERFDYVLCLNVLHHLRYPLYVLDNLSEIVRERLVLEMAALSGNDRRRLGIFPIWGYLLSKAPVIYVSGRATRARKLKKYFFTKGAIRNILHHHRRIFANVQLKPSEHKGRFVVLAERYNIEHLIVVAGPAASGMTKFAKELSSGGHSDVAKKIGIDGKMVYLDTERPSGNNEAHINTAIISYDILRAFMRTGQVYERDELLDILACAKKISVVTLWRDPSVLRAAYEKIGYNKVIVKWQTKRQRNIMASYADTLQIISHYDRWFGYLESAGIQPDVLMMDEKPADLVSSKAWRKKATGASK
jgi:2-polyprenyl-3-methyl-5-hydroxy-6-metoxy-1,4-benzoquinol methylase